MAWREGGEFNGPRAEELCENLLATLEKKLC